MEAIRQSGLAMVAMAVVLGTQSIHVAAQVGGKPAGTGVSTSTSSERTIVVSLEDRKLALIENGQVKKVYPVAVGKPATPSPTGQFKIERRVTNPTYSHDGRVVPPGPNNPVGTRWMGLSIKGYGIHGTNEPESIGKAASHGCIRMARPDIEELYALVEVGDTVELVGKRNEETARLFSPDQKPASPSPSSAMQTATADTMPDASTNANRTGSVKSLAEAAAIVTATGTM